MAKRCYFDGVPDVRLTTAEGIPSKLVIPGHALYGRLGRELPQDALARAIADANGLRWTGVCREIEPGLFEARFTSKWQVAPKIADWRMPAASVTFRVHREKNSCR